MGVGLVTRVPADTCRYGEAHQAHPAAFCSLTSVPKREAEGTS